MNAQATQPAKIAKPPPQRRNPDARREQNRNASRNYRNTISSQKRKEKLALLDQLTSQSTVSVDQPRQSNSHAGNSQRSREQCHSADPVPDPEIELIDLAVDQAAVHAPAAQKNHVLTGRLTDHGFNAWSGTRSLQAHPSTALSTNESWQLSNSSSSTSSPPTSLEDDEAVLTALQHIQTLSVSQKRALLRHLKEQTPALEPAPAIIPGATWASSHNTPPGPPRSRLQEEARRFATFIDRHMTGTLSPMQLSRIYVVEAGLFGALFANCYALGMSDIGPMIVENGCSPFSIGPETGYHESQLVSIKPRFRSITPDLQPKDIQLTFGHHPYIDVIPFGDFRQRTLQALSAEDVTLDEDQLCLDLGGGGLVCWGSQQSSLGMEAGVPWDARSWEPQMWFMKKYWDLVGGFEGEMYKSLEWWHQTRGQQVSW
ncbi:uncharacterized protein J7T54_008243 [Emericellopsis cladophorae]|uniref:BZIP domain-containing protein n=1 Tax=Emericellopsis cladophorae TaxID=2686198 RepID=A0A9P9XY66_9HYPO|nr:uncharacterized protein J7T54_008243 [Emericellopsis cladophorae]KAI6779625.1 hypothetical protein J7T54_008243 [Emericellopsis cladophorae]